MKKKPNDEWFVCRLYWKLTIECQGIHISKIYIIYMYMYMTFKHAKL